MIITAGSMEAARHGNGAVGKTLRPGQQAAVRKRVRQPQL